MKKILIPIIGAFSLIVWFFVVYYFICILTGFLGIVCRIDQTEKTVSDLFWFFAILCLFIIHFSYRVYSLIVKWTGHSIFAVTFAAVAILFTNFWIPIVNGDPSVPRSTREVLPLFAVVQSIYIIISCVSTYRYRYRNRKIEKDVENKEIAVTGELPEKSGKKAKMKISDIQKLAFCFTLTAVVMLLIGLADGPPIGFFMFLRIVTCVSLVFFCREKIPIWGKFVFIMGAILYNPVFPIHLGESNRDVWRLFNVITVLLLCAGIVFVLCRLKREAKNGIEETR